MKRLFIPSFYFLFSCCTACNTATEKGEPIQQVAPSPQPSLATFTDTLQKIEANPKTSIEEVLGLYAVLAPHDSTGADSAASALWRFVTAMVAKANDSLLKDTLDYTALLDPANHSLNDRQKTVKTGFHTKRLKLVPNGEGGAYLVPRYETILPAVQSKTSLPVDHYFNLIAKEDTTPVLLDAGLVVELPELADRLITSEQLLGQPLPKQFAAEALRLNRFYTHILVMGADNTPSISYDSTALHEDFKKGYDYLLSKYPSTKAAAKINVWMAVVATKDNRKINDYRRTIQ